MPVLEAMVQRWGTAILDDGGHLIRSAVAERVFEDPAELDALNSIVHPAVAEVMAARRSEAHARDPDAVIVLDIPLLVRSDTEPIAERYRHLAGIVVVDADVEVAAQRLVAQRSFNSGDARARIASQASRQARLAVADFVIDNNGTLHDLEPQIDACWAWAKSLA